MKRKTKEVKKEAKLLEITILCPVLNKEVKCDNYSFSSSEQECELCGSHGSISIYIYGCECGKYHDIELSSW